MPDENNIQQVTNKSRVEQLLEAWAGGEQIELWAPQSNIERILMNILGATGVDINPIQSRNEALLLQILENGGGSGGGGSSDFSTATVTVTIIDQSGQGVETLDACICAAEEMEEGGYIVANPGLLSGTYLVPLYKGMCIWVIVSDNSWTIQTTGDIQYEQGAPFIITGDGTITATYAP